VEPRSVAGPAELPGHVGDRLLIPGCSYLACPAVPPGNRRESHEVSSKALRSDGAREDIGAFGGRTGG
jgi:hypothetical protein